MNRAFRLILSVMVLVLFSFSTGTTLDLLRQTLHKTRKFYEEANVLYMHTDVYGVQTKYRNGQVKLGSADLYRNGYKFYTTGFDREMYCDGKKVLTIDRKSKTATLYKNFDSKKLMKTQSIPVDSLVKFISPADSVVTITGQKSAYRIYRHKQKENYTELIFDAAGGFIKEFNYTINSLDEDLQSPYTMVRVKYSQVSKKLPKQIDFDVDQFITGSGESLKLNTKLLPGYKLKVKKYYYEASVK